MKFSEKIEIEVSQESIFDITQDYDQRLKWDTFLRKAELLGTDTAEVGKKAWCVSKHGLGMETRYVSFNRPKATAITQSKRSLLFRTFSGSWVFKKVNSNRTIVVFTYSFKLNPPFNLTNGLFLSILRKNVRQRLTDLKLYSEKDQVS